MSPFTKIPSLQKLLATQISGLGANFPQLSDILGVLLSGSCARGEATYRSDIDLLVILGSGPLNYGRVRQIRDEIEKSFDAIGRSDLFLSPLPVEVTVVLASVFQTDEPEMKSALKSSIVLWDPEGALAKYDKFKASA